MIKLDTPHESFAGYVAYKLGEKIDKLIIVASGISPQKKKNENNFIKKGSDDLVDTYMGLWSDPDLGYAGDDFVG